MHPGLLIGWVLLNAIGALISALVRHRDEGRSERRAGSLWKKYGSYMLITGGMLYVGSRMRSLFYHVLWLGGATMWRELSAAADATDKDSRRLIKPIGTVFIVTGVIGAAMIKLQDPTGDSWGWFWLVVATTDAYSQLFGQGWGEAKMAPRLSPGKTWFGFFAGTASAVLAGVLMSFALHPASLVEVFLIALATSLAATAGDLLESWMKRVIGIKDFSSSLGLHGGLLDRFDSLLGAAPVFALALWYL